MEDIIIEFFKKEIINDYKCDNCERKEKIAKTMEIIKFPRILIVNVKRFIHYPIMKKLNNKIAVTEELDLTDFYADPAYDKSKKGRKFMKTEKLNGEYKLKALVEHYGTIDYGHYIAYCQNEKINGWVLFNDERIRKVSDRNFIEECDSGVYIMFYEMI